MHVRNAFTMSSGMPQVTTNAITITGRTLEIIVPRNLYLPFVEFRDGETKNMEIFIADKDTVEKSGLIFATPAWDIGEEEMPLLLLFSCSFLLLWCCGC